MPKIDEVHYIASITNVSIFGISEAKLEEIIWSSESEVDGYNLVRLNQSRRGGGVACYIMLVVFAVIAKVFLLTFSCVYLSQPYWVSYIDYLINQILLKALISFDRNCGFR